MTETFYTYMDSPVGRLLLAGDEESLQLIGFPEGRMARQPGPDWMRRNSVFSEVKEQLQSYFAGELQRFSLALKPRGTGFQREVWQALREIPYGETRSYGEIAASVGRPEASRAVGAANGVNPIPIIIPCHRVIGSKGALTGFGGGLQTKEYLLQLEKSSLPFELA